MLNPGRLAGWGDNAYSQIDCPITVTDAIAVVVGDYHAIALREGGTVSAWGLNVSGQTNINGATNVIGIAAGGSHSLAVKSDGSVSGWGANNYGQTTIPTNINNNAVSVAASGAMSFALLTNGTVVQWGRTNAAIPASATNVMTISGGPSYCLALRSNGTLVAWGSGPQTNVPSNLSNVVAVAGGAFHSLALLTNGTVVSWGSITETNIPSGLSNVMAIAAGLRHSVALRNDGTILSWGDNSSGQTNVLSPLTAYTTNSPVKLIAAGGNQTIVGVFSSLTQYQIDVRKDLLLIFNTTSSNSIVVKDYYLAHRPMASGANVLGISCSTNVLEPISTNEFTSQILPTVRAWFTNNPTKHPQYLILFPDIPTRIWTATNSGIKVESMAFGLSQDVPGIQPFVNSLNMGFSNLTNDCINYINKLASIGGSNNLLLSASPLAYANTNYIVDDVYWSPPVLNDPVLRTTNGLINAGVPWSSIVLSQGNDVCLQYYTNAQGQSGACTNFITGPHIGTATNVAGYICWGAHSALTNEYARNGAVAWRGNSSWWIIQTIESFNGQPLGGHGNFTQWFSQGAFGGTNYENTPVGAICYTDEPGGYTTDAATYFGLWAQGKNFAICAWVSTASSALSTPYFQAVGDPFVRK